MQDQLQSRQCTSSLLMVAPHDFEFNAETSWDNEFQTKPNISPAVINQRAMDEFQTMVETLRQHGLSVLIPERRTTGSRTPDAVFPNNWFATERDGTMVLFPMAPPGRRMEKRITAVESVLDQNGYLVRNIINIGRHYETEHFLEGTGCLVIDHDRRIVYAAESERCHPEQLENFASLLQYETVLFHTISVTGKPVYHTNDMMSIGERFAVLCAECIATPEERALVVGRLAAHHHVITISIEQMQRMCANILQVRTKDGQSLIVMSQRAHDSFTEDQRRLLREYGTLLPISLDTIEQVGGGSARCMMAEVFLPER